jgi:hypothetical protein
MSLPLSRLGDAAGDGTNTNALFLKQFSGEVITAFETSNIMMPLHTVRTISQGKSAQFPVIGTTNAQYHTPGNSLIEATPAGGEFEDFKHNERLIHIDDLLVSTAFIDSLDEAKNHYDYRSEYSRKMGYALSKRADEHLLSVIAEASQAGETAPQAAGGGTIEIGTHATGVADSAITSAALVSALFEAASKMDIAGIPDEDRYIVMNPTLYYNLISNGSVGFDITTTVANSDIGGSGFGSGKVPMIAGFEIYKTAHLPTVDQADGAATIYAGANNDYTTNAATAKLKGVIFHKSAVGTVKLRDLSMEAEYQIERQGTLMVAKYAMGHGMLRPEAAYSLVNAT